MPGDIQTDMNYSKEAKLGVKPYIYTYKRTPAEVAKSHLKVDRDHSLESIVPTTIKDARGMENELVLDKHSFQLVDCPTALSTWDFYNDEQKIHDVYYKEVEDILKKYTGCEYVHIFHHQLRNADLTTKSETSGDRCKIHKYAGRIHLDYHGENAKGIFKDVAARLPEKYSKGRFLFINIWKNISEEPVGNDAMAMCDETSLAKPDDIIAADYFDKLFPVQHYRLVDYNAKQHRWYYYSGMKKDEALLFKQWDSDTTQEGRMCFHTSFHDENAPECASRQSIETRCLVFFPDHEPNTCPSLAEIDKSLQGDYTFMENLEVDEDEKPEDTVVEH